MAEKITTFPILAPINTASNGSTFSPTGTGGGVKNSGTPGFSSSFQGDIFCNFGRFGNGTDYWDISATSMQSANFVTGVSGCQILYSGNVEFNEGIFRGTITTANVTLTGGVIRYQKTSFTDSVNAGYYNGPEGIYYGAAADVSKLKYDITTGVFDFIGTVSGRSTLTIATSINASGQLVTDIVNGKLDTSAKTILDAFTFGVSGALQIGTYVNGVSGDTRISPNGILARNASGVNTFAIDGTTGALTLLGSITSTSGSIGGWSIGATTLSATSGGNTTTLSSGATAFSAGPTASPTTTITQAGVLSATGASITGTITATAGTIGNWTISGNSFSTPSNNIFIGLNAGRINTAQENIFIGYNVGDSTDNINSNSNVCIGSYSFYKNRSGEMNVAIGTSTLRFNTEGDGNTALGPLALYSNTTGNENVAIGHQAGYFNSTGSSSIYIGNYAGWFETESNKLFIDNQKHNGEADARTSALIYGVFNATISSQTLTANAAFTATYGINIPTGQTYKINNVALAVGDITGAAPLASPSFTTPTLGAATCTTINALTLTAAAVGFTIAGGTTSKTLTLDADLTASVIPTSSTACMLAGDQTVNGIKTFGSIPLLPASDPTTDNQAARKAYVDAVPKVYFASDSLIQSADTERSFTGSDVYNSGSPTKNIRVPVGSTYRVKFDLKAQAGSRVYAKIYKNGSAVGTERETIDTNYATYSEDFTGIVPGDYIQLCVKGFNSSSVGYVRNFRIYATALTSLSVITD